MRILVKQTMIFVLCQGQIRTKYQLSPWQLFTIEHGQCQELIGCKNSSNIPITLPFGTGFWQYDIFIFQHISSFFNMRKPG
jgi:hypothetical protein